MKRIISLFMLAVMALNLVACTCADCKVETISCEDLLCDLPEGTVGTMEELTPGTSGLPGFAVRLLQAGAEEGRNTLLSPLSVMYALAMTANGAKGETLRQMESVLGMSVSQLNVYLYNHAKSLEEAEGKLKVANSIWFTDDQRFAVEQPFLQTVKDHYDAAVYRVPFDDITCRDINNWVKEKTDGLIPEILDEIPEEAVMYLVNALAFEAKWQETYERGDVRDAVFTLEDGTTRKIKLMDSVESLYLETGNATGFIKKYEGGGYAFAALLPNDCTVAELVESLDGAQLQQLLENPQQTTVLAAIPKFETAYSTEMSEVLKAMGMPGAFDHSKADLTGLGYSTDGNLFINRVLHKTFISVGEQGTKAGAATVVEVTDECAAVYDEVTKTVFLDRPFVYMLIDTDTCTPIFIGTMMDPSK